MQKKGDPKTDVHRGERSAKNARDRVENALAEDKALDAAVRRSIKLHGA